jgi:hypothetical protein
VYTQRFVHAPESLLGVLRRAAFSGGPAAALAVLPADGSVPPWLDPPRPRWLAGVLVRGVAEQGAGRIDDAVATLRDAAARAERLGLLPLVWPARRVLADTLDRIRPEAASNELAAAVLAICEILMPLPAAEAARLLARPDIRPLVETYLKSRPERADEVTRTDYILHERVFITGGEGRRDPAWAEEGDRDQRAHL